MDLDREFRAAAAGEDSPDAVVLEQPAASGGLNRSVTDIGKGGAATAVAATAKASGPATKTGTSGGTTTTTTSTVTLDEALPLDPKLRHGMLGNGFEYFVRPCAKPAQSCELRLVVKVGSLCEEEDERGLAHFVEHMGFKGTTSFGHGELIAYLSSLGMQYGSCLNAHTNQDETVYKLSVPLPKTLHAAEDKDATGGDSRRDRLSMALGVLQEWASGMRISDEDVETERRVIEEEWRGKNGVSRRILHKYWEAIFGMGGAQRIAERFPIGLPEVFMHCDPQKVRDFYHKWYRPELMAVIVVGDFDGCESDHIIDIIHSTFANMRTHHTSITNSPSLMERGAEEPPSTPPKAPPQSQPNPASPASLASASLPLSVPPVILPRHPHDLVLVLEDAELTQTSVSLEFFETLTVANTLSHVRSDVTKRLFTTLIDQRLGAISRQCDGDGAGPFLGAGIACRPVVPSLNCCTINAICKDDPESISRAVEALVEECERAVIHGFTASELTMAKLKWKSAFSLQLAQEANSMEVVEDARQYFTRDHATPFAGQDVELSACLQLTDDITLDEVNTYCKRFEVATMGTGQEQEQDQGEAEAEAEAEAEGSPLKAASGPYVVPSDPHRFRQLTLQHPINKSIDGTIEGSWTSQRVRALLANTLAKIRSAPPEPWTDLGIVESLMPTPPAPGHAVAVRHMPKIDATEVELSNGIVVAFQRSTRRKEHIAFQGFALGGSSELSELDETAWCMLDEVAGLSGLADLDGDALANLTSTWQTRVNTQRHTYHRGIGGSCPATRLELLLQLLHLKLSPNKQRFRAGSLAKVVSVQLEGIKHRGKTPEFHFGEKARLAAYGDQPIMRPMSAEALRKVTVDDLSRLYETGFTAAPSSFSFSFVGELPEDEVLLPLLEKYIGSLKPLTNAATTTDKTNKTITHVGAPEPSTNTITDNFTTTTTTDAKPDPIIALKKEVQTPPSVLAGAVCGVCPSKFQVLERADGGVGGGGAQVRLGEAEGEAAGAGPKLTGSASASASPWALRAGQTVFTPTPLDTIFTPGKDIVRAGRHTLDVKASCLLAWRALMPPNEPSADAALEMRIKAACTVLETRLLSVLRTENSQVYNVSVGWGRTSLNPWGMINVGYGCDPERIEEVEGMLREELERFKAEGPTLEEVESAKSILTERHQKALENNSYHLFWLLDAYKAFKALEAAGIAPTDAEADADAAADNLGSGEATTNAARAAFVDSEAAGQSVERVKLHISPLTQEIVRATVEEVMPLEASLSLTLLPEIEMKEAVTEEKAGEGAEGGTKPLSAHSSL